MVAQTSWVSTNLHHLNGQARLSCNYSDFTSAAPSSLAPSAATVPSYSYYFVNAASSTVSSLEREYHKADAYITATHLPLLCQQKPLSSCHLFVSHERSAHIFLHHLVHLHTCMCCLASYLVCMCSILVNLSVILKLCLSVSPTKHAPSRAEQLLPLLCTVKLWPGLTKRVLSPMTGNAIFSHKYKVTWMHY